jgi:hypothetical protein
MMKKLLTLILVLGLVPMATAGLSLNVDPAAKSIAVVFDPADGAMIGYDLRVEIVPGVLLGDAVLGAKGNWMTKPAIVSTTESDIRITAGAFPAFGFNGLAEMDTILAISYMPTSIPYTVNLYNASAVQIGDVSLPKGLIQSVVIPEPMSLALLGLGGLFLRRRK